MKKTTNKIIDVEVEPVKVTDVNTKNTGASLEPKIIAPPPSPNPKVEMAKVTDLKPHPQNEKFYGPPKINEKLKENIQRVGIWQPLMVNSDGTTLQGNSRWLIANDLGIPEVPVIRVDIPDPIDQLEMILSGNVQRDKTNEERAREYEGYREIESARAKKRQATNTGAVDDQEKTVKPKSTQGSKKTDSQGGKNFSEAGKARDLAAEKVGWSGPTADKALKVMKVIDDLRKNDPSSQFLKEITEDLNSSVDSAFQECKRKGFIKAAVKENSDSVQMKLKLQASDRSYAARLFNPFTNDLTLDPKAMASLKALAPGSSDPFKSLVVLPASLDPLDQKVEDAVIGEFAKQMGEASDWVCLIETGKFERATKTDWPDNVWVGFVVSTQTEIEQAEKAAPNIAAKNVWLHCRIDSEGLAIKNMDSYSWVVISLANDKIDWVDVEPILKQARREKIPVFFDASVKCRPQELPKPKKAAA